MTVHTAERDTTPRADEGGLDAVAAALSERRDELVAEICAYPTPIPACDAHFNWLLEMRSAVFAELRELFALRAGRCSADALAHFVEASVSLSPAVRQQLLAALGARRPEA